MKRAFASQQSLAEEARSGGRRGVCINLEWKEPTKLLLASYESDGLHLSKRGESADRTPKST